MDLVLDFGSSLSGRDGGWTALVPQLVVKTVLLLGAAALLSLTLRRASAAARHLVWALAIAGVLLLPVVSAYTPWRLPVIPSVGGAAPRLAPGFDIAATPPPSPAATRILPDADETPTPPPALSAVADGRRTHRVEVWMVLLVVWGAGAALFLGRFLFGTATVWWLSLRAADAGEAWDGVAARVARRTGLKTPVRILRSSWTDMPLTWGVLRPVVLLPAGADEWTEERKEVVLLHEAAHVRRRDVVTLALAQVACALHWFNPLAWIALRRMRAEAECACDDWVLRAGTRASTYADHLLSMVRMVGRSRVPFALAVPMAQRSTFEGRLLAILEPGVERGLTRRGQVLLTTAVFAGLIAVLGALAPASSSATPAPRFAADDEDAPRSEESRAPRPSALRESAGMKDGGARDEDDYREQVVERLEGVAAPGVVAALASGWAAKDQEGASPRATAAAVDALLPGLRDEVAEVRVHVAHALGDLGDPRAVQALSAALRGDSDPKVREMAAWALGNIQDAAALPALTHALGADRVPEVRKTAAWALGQIQSAQAIDALAGAVDDADAEVRSTVVWALGQIQDRRAIPALSAALRDGDARIRKTAVWALGQVQDRATVPVLTPLLRDRDAEVRATAVWALGQVQSEDAVDALLAVLRDPEAKVRKQAAWALGQIGSARAVAGLSAAARDDDDVEVRETAVWALGQIGETSAVPALTAALRDRAADVRTDAAWALGQIGSESAAGALGEALRDADARVRRQAAWALGQIESDAAVPALRAALRDADRQVRLSAMRALARTGDEAAAQAVADMLKDEDPEVRAAAARMMGGGGGWHVDPQPRPRPQPQPQPRPWPRN